MGVYDRIRLSRKFLYTASIMGYYIYENWRAGPHKAVIHQGSCGHCRDGKGRAGGYDPDNAKWHGPIKDLDDARSYQHSMNVIERKECQCVGRLDY